MSSQVFMVEMLIKLYCIFQSPMLRIEAFDHILWMEPRRINQYKKRCRYQRQVTELGVDIRMRNSTSHIYP